MEKKENKNDLERIEIFINSWIKEIFYADISFSIFLKQQ